MHNNIKMFKEWWGIAKPSKKYLFATFFTALIASICPILESIYAAKVITCLTKGAFLVAAIFLLGQFILIVERALAWHFNYSFYVKVLGHTYTQLQEKMYDKIINSQNKNFRANPKEKLLNIFHSDAETIGDFNDVISDAAANILRVVITIGAIFTINWMVGLVIIGVDIMNFFVLNHLNSNYSRAKKKEREAVDKAYETFAEIVDKKDVVKDLRIQDKMKKKYLRTGSKYLERLNQKNMASSTIDNLFFIFYQGIVFVLTLALIFLLSQNKLDLTLYLIVIPYLTSGIQVANEFFTVFKSLSNTSISVNRVKIILGFKENEISRFGDKDIDDILGKVDFKDVSFTTKNFNGERCEGLTDININIKKREAVLILGQKKSGKRTLAKLLLRMVPPDSGTIYLDGIDIMNYTEKVYVSNVNYVTTKPEFLEGTILYNLHLLGANQKDILNACDELDITDQVLALPKGLKTDVSSLSLYQKYLVALIRLYLTRSEVVLLYEYPTYLTEAEQLSLNQVLDNIKKVKTFIIVTHDKNCYDNFDQKIHIENGKIISNEKR